MEQLNLFDIKFPIYSITKSYKRIWTEMNVTFIETYSGVYVLDNKNIDGDTVGKRRLRIKNDIYKLYVPRKVLYSVPHLIRSNESIFMDTMGTVFKYKKTETAKLVYYKVDGVIEAEDGECILHVHKIDWSYKTNCRNAYSIIYIGLLHSKYGYIPYDFSETKGKDSWRKI
jgi:hypothetical protein